MLAFKQVVADQVQTDDWFRYLRMELVTLMSNGGVC